MASYTIFKSFRVALNLRVSGLIPKSLSLVLKSAVVLFPLLAGGFLTFLGGERLYEANTVQVERWTAPFGLLAFSSTQLDYLGGTNKEFIKIGIQADIRVKETNILQGIVHCAVYGDFQLPSYDGKEDKEVLIGIQFPFKVVNPRNIGLTWDDPSGGQTEIPIKDVNVSIVEDNLINSIFFIEFIRPQTTGFVPQHFGFGLDFEWEGIIHREGFSTFTFSLPVALGVSSEFVQPYVQNPNALYVYYAETLGLLVEITFPLEFEVKQAYPQTEMMRVDVGSDAQNLFWEINAEPAHFKATQLVSVDFEDKRLSETRSKLIFDSGLYMGLGVALILSGIHEAVRVLSEIREKGKPT